MQEIKIRVANQSDIAVINQLATKIWHDHYPGIITVEQINFMLDKTCMNFSSSAGLWTRFCELTN